MLVRHRSPLSPSIGTAFGSVIDRSFDRTFDQLTSSLFDARRRFPEVQATWDADTLVLTVDLPGVAADSVSVEVAGRSLTLGAHTDTLEWSRSLQLGPSLDPAKITARHLDGRLTVRVGAVDAPEARSIAIDTTPAEPAAIESTAGDRQASDTQASDS
jgi:HSP20 family molecular chaperone IbpA